MLFVENTVQRQLAANWVGFYPDGQRNLNRTVIIIVTDEFDNSSTARDNDGLTASLKRFWGLESMGVNSVESEIPSEQQSFVDNIRFNGTRYEVGLQRKGNHRTIDDDYELCRNRLRSLHQKLLKDPKHLEEYNRNIQEQLAMGIVEEVPPSSNGQKNIHYLRMQYGGRSCF